MTTNYIKDPYFLKCFDFTIKNEGGYNEIKFDNGGATNYGVSLRFLNDTTKDIPIQIKLADFGMAGFVSSNGYLYGRCGTPGKINF